VPWVAPNVFGYPINPIPKDSQKEKTRKKEAKQQSQSHNHGMDTRVSQKILRLPQKLFKFFHDVDPYD